jgi:hypothetical protein
MECDREKWHVGKEIPIALIFGMLMQTAGVVWWAASLSGKIDNLAEQVAWLKADSHLQANAYKDIAVIIQRIDANDRRILQIESYTRPR